MNEVGCVSNNGRQSVRSYSNQVVTLHASRPSAENWMTLDRKKRGSGCEAEEGGGTPVAWEPCRVRCGSEGTKHWSYDNTVWETASWSVCRGTSVMIHFSVFSKDNFSVICICVLHFSFSIRTLRRRETFKNNTFFKVQDIYWDSFLGFLGVN